MTPPRLSAYCCTAAGMTSPPEGAGNTDSAGALAPMAPPGADGPAQADKKASAVTFEEGSAAAAAGGEMQARSGEPPSARQVGGAQQTWQRAQGQGGQSDVHLFVGSI